MAVLKHGSLLFLGLALSAVQLASAEEAPKIVTLPSEEIYIPHEAWSTYDGSPSLILELKDIDVADLLIVQIDDGKIRLLHHGPVEAKDLIGEAPQPGTPLFGQMHLEASYSKILFRVKCRQSRSGSIDLFARPSGPPRDPYGSTKWVRILSGGDCAGPAIVEREVRLSSLGGF